MITRLLAFSLTAACLTPVVGASEGADVARAWREAHEVQILQQFADFLRLPNRAADAKDIERVAVFARERLGEVGVEAQLLRVEGAPPVVYGRLDVPGATRTLGIYVHYDGQPVDPSRWRHPPFEPTLYSASMEAEGVAIPFPEVGDLVDPEWRLYARSAGDDKAPIAALLPVLRAFQAAGIAPSSNLVFLFDGEEEVGSPHLEDYLRRYARRFDDVDIWLFLDGPVHQSGRPQLTFGVRGVMGMEVTVYGATRNLHSGHYGNWAPDTPALLARLLASMKDDRGRVLVPGWYDSADPVGEAELAALRALPDYDDILRRELGIAHSEGAPASLAERLLLPALTIRGLNSGNTGVLARNVIPREATAALGIRLVQGNDPSHMGQLILRHIEAQGYHVVRETPDLATRLAHPRLVKVTGGEDGYPAARTSMSNPWARQVLSAVRAASTRAFGADSLVVSPGMGGTLPLYLFTEVAGKPAVIVPVANHDNNQHAPDENLRIANLWYAIDLYGALLTMPDAVPEASLAPRLPSKQGKAPLTTVKGAPATSRVRFLNSGAVLPTTLPFSEAVEVDDTLYLSGQIGVVPGSTTLVDGGVASEARRALENMELVLKAHGYGRRDVVKCLVMLADIAEWPAFNE
ncbi:MAG: M20/M25/M40 family metallo-hydrolase, partial [Pseudomonadota bacterium]